MVLLPVLFLLRKYYFIFWCVFERWKVWKHFTFRLLLMEIPVYMKVQFRGRNSWDTALVCIDTFLVHLVMIYFFYESIRHIGMRRVNHARSQGFLWFMEKLNICDKICAVAYQHVILLLLSIVFFLCVFLFKCVWKVT